MPKWLLSEVKQYIPRAENAQAMVFFAVVISAIALTCGLALEGGRAFVEYRRMQAAADMAAIVGAQALPCTLSDFTCITPAETLACQTAVNNGFSCANGNVLPAGTPVVAAPAAYVPPVTCSPYDPIDYGNDNGDPAPFGNASCKSTPAGLNLYSYMEVKLTDDLGVVPIFNVPIVLSAHAVARHGVPSPKDYAVSQLDKSAAGQLSVSNNFTFFVNGAIFANGVLKPGKNASTTCEGGYFTASNTPDPGTETTFPGGIAGFAPPACYQSDGTTLQTASTPNWDSNLPPITDPYCSSVSAPYLTTVGTDCNNNTFGDSTIPNCTDCTKFGWYYDQTTSTWTQDTKSSNDINKGGSGGDTFELFPGVYGSFQLGSNDHAYLNPGVYTFTGTVSFDKGNLCIFGAPICNSGATPTGQTPPVCGDTTLTWTPGATQGSNATGNQWYYNCSPFGFWDTQLWRPASANATAATVPCASSPTFGPSCSAPTWWDTTKTSSPSVNGRVGGVSSIPLNGATFQFIDPDAKSIGGTGAGNSGLAYYLAAPNPCPGTGTGWVKDATAVSFNNGDPAAQYKYIAASSDTLATTRYGVGYLSPIVANWGWNNGVQNVSASQIYPSMDSKTSGECAPDNLEVWPGEMGGKKGQHIHFAMFDRQANDLFKFAGNQGQSFLGIMYFPGNGVTGPTFDSTGAGAAGGGIPFIYGQLVAWDVTFGGSGAVDLIFRPCNDKEDVCASGLGTQLIQ